MGVAGSGKSTIGARLADRLGCAFVDADGLHTPANVEKMRRGIGLTDADRGPWLAAIHARILEAFRVGKDLVVACSALKETYREVLAKDVPITWVYLTGSPELIASRLANRLGHFATESLLASQLHALEEPHDAIVVDVAPAPETIVKTILSALARRP